MSADRIHDRAHERRIDEIALEFDAFGDRARDDRRGRRGEHRLEEEEGPVPDAFARAERRHTESAPPEPPRRLRRAEHQRRAEDVERQRADGEVHQVLHHDVRRVLRPRETRLDQREAGLHQEYENRRHQRPDDVQIGLYRLCSSGIIG